MSETQGVWYPNRRINLLAASYELGEVIEEVQDHPGLPTLMCLHKMQEDPHLWGWGTYRKTSRTQAQLAVAAAKRAMDAALVGPQAIDAVVLCSVSFPPGVSASLAFVNEVMGALNLDGTPYWGVTLGRCSSAMAGLSLAATLLAAGRSENVLVVTADKIDDEKMRLEPFGVFSDAASACIMGTSGRGAALACMHQVSAHSSGTDMSTSLTGASRLALHTTAPQLMQSVVQVFHDNLFLPIIAMREQLAGFKSEQLYLKNSARVGHAFGADPVINLVDALQAKALEEGDAFAFVSGTPGLRHTLVWHHSDHLALAASS